MSADISSVSAETWLVRLGRLVESDRRLQWEIGDALVEGRDRFDIRYSDVSRRFGCSESWLRQLDMVSRKVAPEVRRDDLPWGSHRAVAGLEADEQRRWLAVCADERLTAEELRARMRDGLGAPAHELTDENGEPTGMLSNGLPKLTDEQRNRAQAEIRKNRGRFGGVIRQRVRGLKGPDGEDVVNVHTKHDQESTTVLTPYVLPQHRADGED